MNQKACIACGKKIKQEAQFCKYCGAEQPQQRSENDVRLPQTNESVNHVQSDARKGKGVSGRGEPRKIVPIVIICILLLVIGALVGYIISDHSPAKQEADQHSDEITVNDEEEGKEEIGLKDEPADVAAEETVKDTVEETQQEGQEFRMVYGAYLREQGADFSEDVQGMGLFDVNGDGEPELLLVDGEFEPYLWIYTINSSGQVECAADCFLGWGREEFTDTTFGAIHKLNNVVEIYGTLEGDGFYGHHTRIFEDFDVTVEEEATSYEEDGEVINSVVVEGDELYGITDAAETFFRDANLALNNEYAIYSSREECEILPLEYGIKELDKILDSIEYGMD